MLYCQRQFILYDESVPKWFKPYFSHFIASIGILETIIYFAFPEEYLVFLIMYTGVIISIIIKTFANVRKATGHYTSRMQRILARLSLILYGGGSLVWTVENTLCGMSAEEHAHSDFYKDRQWMHIHALWHISAGLGCWLWIQLALTWRGNFLGKKVGLEWLGLPYVTHGEKLDKKVE